ncbi:MAG TPA: ATP-binding cassette domain-containing protein [Gaiellaceae bacterium]|jgi:daunorubicin resistance ABC transporter ATP-binding subunit|nr:ATP-binding cassette domain-containing protein [Gaiellaceae bacterium]
MTGFPMIVSRGLGKSYGSNVALAGVDLVVSQGTILCLLGRNGAGKTTLVRILATLLAPDTGWAQIAGIEIRRDAARVRQLIGLAGQFAAVDDGLSGRENLELVAGLYGLHRRDARARSQEVLERLGLAQVGNQLVRTYSGGMRRRLDLGASLVGKPAVLIMDEPTTGLDPANRIELWKLIEDLVRDGTTMLLTTQYLEEADRLADQIVVIERGRVIAGGTPDELKQRVGGDVLEVRATNAADVDRIVQLLDGLGTGRPVADMRDQRVTLPTTERVQTLLAAARRIEESNISIADLGVRRPSLDDVFLALTAPGAESRAAVARPSSPGRSTETRTAPA